MRKRNSAFYKICTAVLSVSLVFSSVQMPAQAYDGGAYNDGLRGTFELREDALWDEADMSGDASPEDFGLQVDASRDEADASVETSLVDYGLQDDASWDAADTSVETSPVDYELPEDASWDEADAPEEDVFQENTESVFEILEASEYGYLEEEDAPMPQSVQRRLNAVSAYSTGMDYAAEIPSAYSSVDEGYVTPVRNQGSYGTCWSFSTLAVVESNILKKGISGSYNKADLDFSEHHLAYGVYHREGINDPLGNTGGDYLDNLMIDPSKPSNYGGNFSYARYNLVNWADPAFETEFPYENMPGEIAQEDYHDAQYHVQQCLDYPVELKFTPEGRRVLQEAIMEYGAISGSLFSDKNYTSGNNIYNYEKTSTNHAITIVGWDDDYPAANFKSSISANSASQNGAWYIKNSHGENSGGKGGYYWVSYCDTSLKNFHSVSVETRDNYDHNFFYDGGYSNKYTTVKKGSRVANVYTNTLDKPQRVKAAGIMLAGTDAQMELQIYLDPEKGKPESGTPLLSKPQECRTTYAGYYTFPIEEQISYIPSGSSFSVVFKLLKDCNVRIDYSYTVSDNNGEPQMEHHSAISENTTFQNSTDEAGRESQRTYRIKAYTDDVLDISSYIVSAGMDAYCYTGEAVEPEILVRSGTGQLLDDGNYEVSYENNVEAGEAFVRVTGVGRYGGSASGTFKIIYDLNAGNTQIRLSEKEFYYCGSEIRPSVSVSVSGKQIREGVNYRVLYADNRNAGEAAVTVEALQDARGAATEKFLIRKAPLKVIADDAGCISVDKAPSAYTYHVEGLLGEDKADSVFESEPLVSCVQAGKVSMPGKYPIRVKGGSAKNYELDYVDGVLTVREKPRDTFQVETYGSSFVYQGASIHAIKRVYNKERDLKEGEDYTVVYVNNRNAGTASYTVSGMGIFEDCILSGTFQIVQAPLTVSVKNVSINVCDPLPKTCTLLYKGLRGSDKPGDVWTEKPKAVIGVKDSSVAGIYAFSVSGGTAPNYKVTYAGGTIEVMDPNPVQVQESETGNADIKKVLRGGVEYSVLTVDPSPDYCVKDVLLDGESLGPVTEYEFETAGREHSVNVKYRLIVPEIMVKQKYNVSELFPDLAGQIVKYKVRTVDTGKAKITSKGDMTPSKAGRIEVIPYIRKGGRAVLQEDRAAEVLIVAPAILEDKLNATYKGQKVSGKEYFTVGARGQKVTFAVKPAKKEIIRIHPETGEIEAVNSGKASVVITVQNDQGNKTSITKTFYVKYPNFSVKGNVRLKPGRSKTITMNNMVKGKEIRWTTSDKTVVDLIPNEKNPNKVKLTCCGKGEADITAVIDGKPYTLHVEGWK